MLNGQVASFLLKFDFINTIVVIQKNNTKHLINCLEVQNSTLFENHNLIFFFIKHSQNKKDRNSLFLIQGLPQDIR